MPFSWILTQILGAGGGGIEEQGSSTSILGQTDLTEGGIRELPLPADKKSMQSNCSFWKILFKYDLCPSLILRTGEMEKQTFVTTSYYTFEGKCQVVSR